jgi:rare lipoprotein A
MKISIRIVVQLLSAFLLCDVALSASASVSAPTSTTVSGKKPSAKADLSGKPRRGKASYYSRRFAGRKMADGTPMNPDADIAASRTLPLGTKAKVTNLENGRSAVVEIRDRGPYVDGRIVDLSPKVAKRLDIEEEGVAPVEVQPLELPSSSGGGAAGVSATGK